MDDFQTLKMELFGIVQEWRFAIEAKIDFRYSEIYDIVERIRKTYNEKIITKEEYLKLADSTCIDCIKCTGSWFSVECVRCIDCIRCKHCRRCEGCEDYEIGFLLSAYAV